MFDVALHTRYGQLLYQLPGKPQDSLHESVVHTSLN